MNIDFYLSIAEISGAFIAFGGLISAFSDTSIVQRSLLKGLVGAGLIVLIASLVPVGFTFFQIPEDVTFRLSCGVFLIVIWTMILGIPRAKERHPIEVQFMKNHFLIFFVLFAIEAFIQIPLVISVLGFLSSYWEAFLALALMLNLLQGAIYLSLMVFLKSGKET